jgi:hypothetical protein
MPSPQKSSGVFSYLFAAFCLMLSASILGPKFPGRALCYSLSLIAVCDGFFSLFCNRYNIRHPQAPIRPLFEQLYLAAFIGLVGFYNVLSGYAESEALFVIAGIIAASSVYGHFKNRSRTSKSSLVDHSDES